MRDLKRNQRLIYYAALKNVTEYLDSNGDYTGTNVYTYASPVAFYANVSPVRGTYSREAQGIVNEGERTICTSDMNCPIAEDYAIWIDKPTSINHDYIVTGVERSINSILIRVKKCYIG